LKSAAGSSSSCKLPFFDEHYYRNILCFVLCRKYTCIPKEIEPGMVEIPSSITVDIKAYDVIWVPLNLMILLPVNTYATFTIDPMYGKLGLSIINSLHNESNTGTISLMIKNFSNKKQCIEVNSSLAILTVIPKYTKRFMCLESFELTSSPNDLRQLFEVCKAKENEHLLRI
jgi:hypothetical protein